MTTTTYPKVSTEYKRFTAKDMSLEAIRACKAEAIEYHERTGEAVQLAFANGVVHSFIAADGRRYGNLATFG